MSAEAAWELFMWLIYQSAARRAYREEREYPEYVDIGGEA